MTRSEKLPRWQVKSLAFSLLIVLSGAANAYAEGVSIPPRGAIICVDQSNGGGLFLFDANADWNQNGQILWSWSARSSSDIRADHAKWFGFGTDAKWVLNGTHVLTCASAGGVALIRLKDKHVVFYASAGKGNTHSAELLPDGNIVTASSKGNFLTVFCTDPNVSRVADRIKSVKIRLPGAHGVVWDHRRRLLWAIGRGELRSYRYNGRRHDPNLSLAESFKLPAPRGHDLFPQPGRETLLLSTWDHVWKFDMIAKKFTPFRTMHRASKVKSISQHGLNGPVIVLQARGRWYSDTVRFVNRRLSKKRVGAKFYKARWWVPNAFSYGPAEYREKMRKELLKGMTGS